MKIVFNTNNKNNPSFIEKLKFNNSFIIDTYFKFIRKYFNVKE